MQHGWSDRLGAFKQSYEDERLDAANLVLPIVGFIAGDHPRMIATLDATLDRMGDVFAAVETWHRETDLAVLPDDLDLSALGLAGFARAAVEDLTARRDDPAARDALALLYRLAGGGAP